MRSGLIRRHDVPASRVEAAIHLGPHAKTKGVAKPILAQPRCRVSRPAILENCAALRSVPAVSQASSMCQALA